jgi:hypothetical protein
MSLDRTVPVALAVTFSLLLVGTGIAAGVSTERPPVSTPDGPVDGGLGDSPRPIAPGSDVPGDGRDGSTGTTASDRSSGTRGSVDWERLTDAGDEFRAVVPTGDGGYVAAGTAHVDGVAQAGVVQRFDADGRVVFRTAVEPDGRSELVDLVRTTDGDYVALAAEPTDGTDSPLARLDADGNVEPIAGNWSVTGRPRAIAPRPGGGVAVLLSTDPGPRTPEDDLRLALVDERGRVAATRTYDAGGEEIAGDVVRRPGGYAVLGTAAGNAAWLLEVDDRGRVTANRTYREGVGGRLATALARTPDGGYALAGDGWSEGWVVRIDADGEVSYTERYGRLTGLSSIATLPDGGLLLGGADGPPLLTNGTGAPTGAVLAGRPHRTVGAVVAGDDGSVAVAGTLDGSATGADDARRRGWVATLGPDAPPGLRVSSLDAPKRFTVGDGHGRLNATATVRNPADERVYTGVGYRVDGNGNGTLSPGETVAYRPVVLGPGETATVEFSLAVDGGTFAHGAFAGDASVSTRSLAVPAGTAVVSVATLPSSLRVRPNESATVELVVEGNATGLDSANVALLNSNTTAATVEDFDVAVDGTSSGSAVSFGGGGLLRVDGLDLTGTGDGESRLATVTIRGRTAGTAVIRIYRAELAAASGANYVLNGTRGTTVRVDERDGESESALDPRNTDADPQLEDVDGDGEFTISDVQAFLEAFDDQVVQSNPAAFNFDGSADGEVTIFDVQALLAEL